jgi:hypothetical protein
MRIAIIAKADYAGSGQRFAEALRSQGHHATLCTWQRNVYGYPVDMLADVRHPAPVQALIDAADVVHLKGDHLPSDYQELRMAHKPVVITAGGSGFRRGRDNMERMPWEQQWHPLEEYRRQAQAVGVLTPDLLYPELPATWTPHATAITNTWQAPVGTIIIGHSPSNAAVKGTDRIVLPAVRMLQAMGHDVELKLIRGVSNLECLAQKAKCHIFVDQCIIPAYGLSGVEAMSMGIPLVQRLPPPTERRHPYLQHACPVVAFEQPTPESLYEALAPVLRDRRTLLALHRRTLRYCKQVHGYAAVASALVELYQCATNTYSQTKKRA